MAIEGDFEKLARLKDQLEDMAGLMRKAEERVAEKLQEQLDYQYETGTDPNNEGWAELAPATLARGRKPPPLTDTEEMRRHSKAVRGVGGISVNIDKPKKPKVPRYHQDGTENMPARPLVPEGPDLDKARAWEAKVEEGVGEAFVEHFGGTDE